MGSRLSKLKGSGDTDGLRGVKPLCAQAKEKRTNLMVETADRPEGSTISHTQSPGSNVAGTHTSAGDPNERPIRILLLGSGESGKSTLLKQIKILHQNGYPQEERLMYKPTIYKNLVDCAKSVVDALQKFGISLEDEFSGLPASSSSNNHSDSLLSKPALGLANGPIPETSESTSSKSPNHSLPVSQADLEYVKNAIVAQEYAKQIVENFKHYDFYTSEGVEPEDPDTVFDGQLAAIIENLWACPEIKKLVNERRSEFYIMDSAPYFFDRVHKISHPEYIPSVDDILRARIKSTGIYDTKFDMGGLNVHMYDVGGQCSELKKWIHCFENGTVIIFCVSLSEYDQHLLEEEGQNRMAESLVLFDSIVNSPWFARTSIVLFLNKIDVFTDKLPFSPLENYFSDYTGGSDVNKAVKYILWKFTQKNHSGLNIYPHLTQATDTSNIRLVLAAVKETLLQNFALRDSGIL
jgi:guanine nucleotide-binding protein G(i) subunit alpha